MIFWKWLQCVVKFAFWKWIQTGLFFSKVRHFRPSVLANAWENSSFQWRSDHCWMDLHPPSLNNRCANWPVRLQVDYEVHATDIAILTGGYIHWCTHMRSYMLCRCIKGNRRWNRCIPNMKYNLWATIVWSPKNHPDTSNHTTKCLRDLRWIIPICFQHWLDLHLVMILTILTIYLR